MAVGGCGWLVLFRAAPVSFPFRSVAPRRECAGVVGRVGSTVLSGTRALAVGPVLQDGEEGGGPPVVHRSTVPALSLFRVR